MKEEKRFYEIDDKKFVSVTTALSIIRSFHLERWRGDLGNEAADLIVEEAQDFGLEGHNILAEIDLGNDVVIPPEYSNHVDAWLKWKAEAVKEILFVEEVCYSHKYQFAGRFDRLMVMNGDSMPAVIDCKFSNLIVPKMGLQLAGYGIALKEMGVIDGNYRRLIVRLDKKNPGKLQVREFDNPKDQDAFLYSLALWRHFNQ